MTLTNEDLLALSDMMDKKLKPIENRIKRIEVDLIKDKVLPRMNLPTAELRGIKPKRD